jgi:hypothetical protein
LAYFGQRSSNQFFIFLHKTKEHPPNSQPDLVRQPSLYSNNNYSTSSYWYKNIELESQNVDCISIFCYINYFVIFFIFLFSVGGFPAISYWNLHPKTWQGSHLAIMFNIKPIINAISTYICDPFVFLHPFMYTFLSAIDGIYSCWLLQYNH